MSTNSTDRAESYIEAPLKGAVEAPEGEDEALAYSTGESPAVARMAWDRALNEIKGRLDTSGDKR